MSGTILVLGATGNVGAPLVEALVARGERVRAGSRHPAPVEGAEAVRVDLADPGGVEAAMDGASRVFVLAPVGTTDPASLLSPVFAAAARRGAKVVLQTAMGVETSDEIPIRQAEIALERSGAPWVVLRPNWFMDNFHSYWLAGVRAGSIEVPAAAGATSFVDARDIAAAAAGALTSDAWDGQAFAITGPEALTYGEAAAVLGQAIGRPVAYRPVDDATFVGQMTGAGVPEGYARMLAGIFHAVREGWTAPVSDAVERLSGRAPRTLAAYAADRAALFA
jgi:uncharacterized protein YbjT (DUF2867 family)